MLDGLVALVDASLVKQTIGVDGEPCLQLLETVRAFAWEQLEARGLAQSAADGHLQLFAARAAAAAPLLRMAEAPHWLDRVEGDEPDMLIALERAVGNADAEALLQLLSALLPYWSFRGRLHEGHYWLGRTAPLLAGVHNDEPEPLRALRAWTQFEAGNLCFHGGDLPAAVRFLEASVAEWGTVVRSEPHAGAMAHAVGTLWVANGLSGHHDEASRALAALEALAAAPGNARAQAQLALNHGVSARSSGRRLVAREQLGAALAFYRCAGDLEFLAITLLNLTSVLLILGDEAWAEAHATEALQLGQRLRSQTLLANARNDSARSRAIGVPTVWPSGTTARACSCSGGWTIAVRSRASSITWARWRCGRGTWCAPAGSLWKACGCSPSSGWGGACWRP